jgi:uncharacterized protein (DUF1684 family)
MSFHPKLGRGSIPILLLLSGAAFLSQGCTRQQPEKAPLAEDSVVQERLEKDRAFKTSPNSPIPEKDRMQFGGLKYYPFEPALRFRVKLNRYPRPERIRLGTNTGELRDALKYGYFDFEIASRPCRLQVFRTEDSQEQGVPHLFVPFRDSTSGKETYAAGRYLDLQENTSGMYELDFNRAYNPSCAYSEGFSCPVPPPENTLRIAVRAGEMNYVLAGEH